jgi:hypothetical protein
MRKKAVIIMVAALVSTHCTVSKRHYRPGFYVHSKSSVQEPNPSVRQDAASEATSEKRNAWFTKVTNSVLNVTADTKPEDNLLVYARSKAAAVKTRHRTQPLRPAFQFNGNTDKRAAASYSKIMRSEQINRDTPLDMNISMVLYGIFTVLGFLITLALFITWIWPGFWDWFF